MNDNALPPPSAVTAEVFAQWRSPRAGTANPERMNNPLWEWLIETRQSAFHANQALNGPSPFVQTSPMWCFARYGQSVTQLPDGSTVLIGGEHEDSYDPDFCIYNDLVVKTPDGSIDIFGYPRTDFPPTDFHTASLTDEHIVLIGNLGYPEDRHMGQTQVLLVERTSWKVSRVDSVGNCPGWIHDHHAELEADRATILVRGGKLFRGNELSLIENIDDWRLNLREWRWQRLTDRRWVRFELARQDRAMNHLFGLRTALWKREMKWHDGEADENELQAELGGPLRLDLIPSLYRPLIEHELLPEREDEYGVYRIRVDGVVVRYVEEMYTVQVTVEGQLAADIVEQIRRDVAQVLELLEQSPIESRDIA